MTHVVRQILEEIAEELTLVCQTNVDPDDGAYADIVKVGRFQDDPISSNIAISVIGGDPEDTKYRDGIVSLGDTDDLDINVPPREIGGGEYWWRRGVIVISCFFINEQFSESTAADYAYTVLQRVQSVLDNDGLVAGLTGDDGETALLLLNGGNTFFQSGGPPTNYIWRGRCYWQALTERPS
jgi:hypothetical protein